MQRYQAPAPLARSLRKGFANAGADAGPSMGTMMRQTADQRGEGDTADMLVNRIEEALLSVHPDLWLAGVVLVALAHFLGRLI